MKVTINAGHCPGLDSGAVRSTGLQEAIVAEEIAHKVCGYLASVGYETLFVQENELYQITNASNAFESDIFVSIHCNAAENTDAKGTETFYVKSSPAGGELAQFIQSQIVDSLGTYDRGIKTANFYVTRNTNCPAVLIETAFISNAEDERILADKKQRDELARAISRGITDYVGGGD